jgi:formylglycine-generating enzyme required for sulfatase activity
MKTRSLFFSVSVMITFLFGGAFSQESLGILRKIQMNMVFVPGGTFVKRFREKGIIREKKFKVALFYLDKFETTFDEYDTFCEYTERTRPTDANFGRGQRPVIYVTWWDAIAYCNWLNTLLGLPPSYNSNGQLINDAGEAVTNTSSVSGYRLPMEYEWEYAARAGNSDQYFEEGNKLTNDELLESMKLQQTYPVGTECDSNALGIFDLDGNVWEWCSDLYDMTRDKPDDSPDNPYKWNQTNFYWRVVRGGNYHFTPWNYSVPGMIYPESSFCIGFRIARSSPDFRKKPPKH